MTERDRQRIAAEALAMTMVFEQGAEQLPPGWGYLMWDKLFTDLALLYAELAPALSQEQRLTLLHAGALARGQMKKETEAQSVFGQLMADIRGGKIEE